MNVSLRYSLARAGSCGCLRGVQAAPTLVRNIYTWPLSLLSVCNHQARHIDLEDISVRSSHDRQHRIVHACHNIHAPAVFWLSEGTPAAVEVP
jgi:hypothetical protein